MVSVWAPENGFASYLFPGARRLPLCGQTLNGPVRAPPETGTDVLCDRSERRRNDMAESTDEPTVLRSTGSVRAERERALADRFGGFYWGSDFIGFVVASFFTLIFFGIVGAIVGTVGYQIGAHVPKIGGKIAGETAKLGAAGLIAGLIALFLAYLIGGYSAGRMARFDGVKNGIGVVIWTIIVAIILAIVGAIVGNKFNVANQLHLNISRTDLTTGGVISIVVSLIIMIIASIIGGVMGTNYHRDIDRQAGMVG
jgi:hypothetical protein